MLSFNLNLSKKEWLDVIFERRNKSYGAYWLRTKSAAITARALLLSSVCFVLFFLVPDFINYFKANEPAKPVIKVVDVILQTPPPVDQKVVPPPPELSFPPLKSSQAVQPGPAHNNMVKFPPPIVKADDQVRDEPPQINELKKADPGQATMMGDPTADIVTAGPVGTGVGHAKVVEDTRVYEFNSLEVAPSFPGGIEKFYKFLQNTVSYPESARTNNIQGKVFLSFIIEKNGQLTDIKVDRSAGGELDQEAIRVLKLCPRWTPGIQNGQAVRVKYNIPINFSLSQG